MCPSFIKCDVFSNERGIFTIPPSPVKRGGSLSFLTIFTFAIPELLDLI
jgi:hypothetical protein